MSSVNQRAESLKGTGPRSPLRRFHGQPNGRPQVLGLRRFRERTEHGEGPFAQDRHLLEIVYSLPRIELRRFEQGPGHRQGKSGPRDFAPAGLRIARLWRHRPGRRPRGRWPTGRPCQSAVLRSVGSRHRQQLPRATPASCGTSSVVPAGKGKSRVTESSFVFSNVVTSRRSAPSCGSQGSGNLRPACRSCRASRCWL